MESYGTPRARPEPVSPSRDVPATTGPSTMADATASREGWPWQFQLNARREAGQQGRGTSPMAQQLRALSSGRTNVVNATARASYESALLSAVRRQMDAFEEKWEKKLRQERRDPLSVSTIDRLVERVSALEAPQPRLEKRLAELDGKVKGLSDELQGQIRQVHLLDDRRWEWKQKMEEDLMAKCQGLQQQMQALVASSRTLSLEEDSRQQRNWHSALEDGLSAAARERNAMQQEVHEGFVNVCERLAALEVKSLEDLHRPVATDLATLDSPGNDVATEMLSKRLEDLEKKLEDAVQDNFDIHQRHAAQEEQIRSLRTRFENREEQLRALGERVERSDWDVKLSQIRQALQEHHQERTLHSEKLELLSKRVEYQEHMLEDARFNGAQRPDTLVEEMVPMEDLGVGSSAALALLEDQVKVIGAEIKGLQEAQEDKLGLSSLVNQLKEISPKVISHEKSIRRLEERNASQSESKLTDTSAELAASQEELKARLELLERQAEAPTETDFVTRQDMADEVRDLRHRTEEYLKDLASEVHRRLSQLDSLRNETSLQSQDDHLDELKHSWEKRFQQLQNDGVKGLDVEYRLDRLEARNKVEDEEFLNFRQELQQRMEHMASQVKSLQVSEGLESGYCTEEQILKKEGNWSLNGSTGRYTFDSNTGWLKVGDQHVGRFTCQRIQDRPLSMEVPSFCKLTEKRLSILSSEIMEEIHRKENDGALFVLPSQLNGAEYPSHEDIVYDVEDYKYDNTGGPRAQLAVHPAASQFLLDNAANLQRTGGLNSASGLVSGVQELKVINGYLKIEAGVKEPRSSEILEKLQRELHTFRPLIMENLLAQGVTPDKRVLAQHRHRVGLVYASAVPVNAYLNQCAEDSEALEFQKKVAELFLVAQYYAALTYAAETATARGRKRRVYLMPLGGGVFNNPWEIIATSMAKALQMLDDDLLGMLDISVLAWRGEPFEEQKLLEIFCRLNSNYRQVAQLPVSVSAPADALANVQEETKELRSEMKLSLQDFRQSLEVAALKDEAKEVQLQETQRELQRKLKLMEEELAETKVQLTLWRNSTEEASIERIEATSALSVATRDAVGVLEKDLANLKERIEGANGKELAERKGREDVSEAFGSNRRSHDPQEEGLRELQTQVTNLSERLNAFVAAQIQGHEPSVQPELVVLAETLQKDEREEQEAHARLLLRIDELCSHLSKAAEAPTPWVKLELLGRQVEEMQRAEKQMEAKLESFVSSLAS